LKLLCGIGEAEELASDEPGASCPTACGSIGCGEGSGGLTPLLLVILCTILDTKKGSAATNNESDDVVWRRGENPVMTNDPGRNKFLLLGSGQASFVWVWHWKISL